MATIGLRADVKKLFFDRAGVMKSIRADKRRAMAIAGAKVRTTARRSIRTRKAVSRPGQPPTNRTGLLKRNIFFAYDPPDGGVIIGPARLARGRGEAPSLLEHGGRTRAARRIVKKDQAGQRSVIEKGTVLNIEPRPYMAPALQKIIPELASITAKAIRSL